MGGKPRRYLVTCPRCGYAWLAKIDRPRIMCPRCGKKFRNPFLITPNPPLGEPGEVPDKTYRVNYRVYKKLIDVTKKYMELRGKGGRAEAEALVELVETAIKLVEAVEK